MHSRRPFVVANPDTDDEDVKPSEPYIYRPPPLPAPSLPAHGQTLLPIATFRNLPADPGSTPSKVPSSSSSSHSSTNSPTIESPPPPSTPGVPSRADVNEESFLTTDPYIASYPDRLDIAALSTHQLPIDRYKSNNTLSASVIILVSSDADSFTRIALPAGIGAASILERIFTTARISDIDQQAYTICQTDIETFSRGSSLTHDQVFDLCEQRCLIPSRDSLVFLLTLDPLRSGLGPSIVIPPPVLPIEHLKPKGVPRSKGSLSSTSGDGPELNETLSERDFSGHTYRPPRPPPLSQMSPSTPNGRRIPPIPRQPPVPPPSAPGNATLPLSLKPSRGVPPPHAPSSHPISDDPRSSPDRPYDPNEYDKDRSISSTVLRGNKEPFRHPSDQDGPPDDPWTVLPQTSPIYSRLGSSGNPTSKGRRPNIPPHPTEPPPDRPSDRGPEPRPPKPVRTVRPGGKPVPPRWIGASKPLPSTKSMNDLRSQFSAPSHGQTYPSKPARQTSKPRPGDSSPSLKNSPSGHGTVVPPRYLSPVLSQSSPVHQDARNLPYTGPGSLHAAAAPISVPERPQSVSGDRSIHSPHRRPVNSPTTTSGEDPGSQPRSYPTTRGPVPPSLDATVREWVRPEFSLHSPHSPNTETVTLRPQPSRSYTGPGENLIQATDIAYATTSSGPHDGSDGATLIAHKHRPLPLPSAMATPTLTLATPPPDEDDTDEEDYNDDEAEGLWKKPLGEKRAKSLSKVLSLDIPSPSDASITTNTVQHNLPDREKPHSEFSKQLNETWAFRPPAEVVYDRLDQFFPNHDLDRDVLIDANTTGGTSPTIVEPLTPPTTGARARHKKSIRQCAAERKRIIDRASRMEPLNSTALRRRSTMLWGQKVEEMKPSLSGLQPAVPESPKEPTPPAVVFKWVRGELIGKGTYGRVYLGLNANTGEMIAVKQVEIPRTDSDRADDRQVSVVEALKFESETLKDLDHPHIVQYLGFEETPEYLSIFLEYVPGGSIGGCLRKHGKFAEEVVKSFTGQILDGLEYLHANGILHRDLKADNILVDQSGQCKISDFGISKRTDDIEALGAFTNMQGSVFWMAPEVVHNQKKGYNAKIDIWSVGCVVLEMWAGRRPWINEDVVAVMFKLGTAKSPPPVPADVVLSPLADDFRQKCFAMNPEERPAAPVLRQHAYLTLAPGWKFIGKFS